MVAISWIIIYVTSILSNYVDSSCTGATAHDAEGPYYSQDPPIRSDFTSMDPNADKVFISGQVIDIDTCQGVYSRLDFWSANSTGVYDNQGYNMRGAFYTDNNGYYAFNTRLPGYFAPRAHHYHVKIWVQDVVVLTTQLYFSNYGVIGNTPRDLTLSANQNNDGYITSFTFVVDNVPDTIQDTEPPETGETTTTTTTTSTTSIASEQTKASMNGSVVSIATSATEKETTETYTTTTASTDPSTSITCCGEDGDNGNGDTSNGTMIMTTGWIIIYIVNIIGLLIL